MTYDKPARRPARPFFSSGPCAKRPGWTPSYLQNVESLGRSHRSGIGKKRLKYAIDLNRQLLQVPDSHRLAIVTGSDTGAFEMALWSMLGALPVSVMAWESFGKDWVRDTVDQLKLDPRVLEAPFGEIPDLAQADQDGDVVFTWNGTTSGARVPNGDWIRDDRKGLTFADATSAVFATRMPWDKLDVTTYSWQKALGGEAAHGILILSPRAVARLESWQPTWPLPKLFRMTKKGKLDEALFEGATINTPSMMCVEDCIDVLEWGLGLGGLDAMIARADANAAALDAWISQSDWADYLTADPALRTNTGVCLRVVDPVHADNPDTPKKVAKLLEQEGVAFDIAGYRDAPPGLRIWCGPTVDADDVAALGPWLDWAFKTVS